jgi:hypothetical protein
MGSGRNAIALQGRDRASTVKPISVGWDNSSGFKGVIAHVAIWNRLLSPTEIDALWSAGQSELLSTPNLSQLRRPELRRCTDRDRLPFDTTACAIPQRKRMARIGWLDDRNGWAQCSPTILHKHRSMRCGWARE